jgi:RNA polymerase sigma factor (sigma-70 family)
MKGQISFSHYRKLSDEELTYRYLHRGEQLVIFFLYEKYGHLVYGVCRKHLTLPARAQAAMQDIFMRLPEWLEEESVEPLRFRLLRITHNYCMRLNEPSEAPGSMPVPLGEPLPPANAPVPAAASPLGQPPQAPAADERTMAEAARQRLELVWDSMNPSLRVYMELFYSRKRSFAEIAGETGCTPREVEIHIREGKQYLRQHLIKG